MNKFFLENFYVYRAFDNYVDYSVTIVLVCDDEDPPFIDIDCRQELDATYCAEPQARGWSIDTCGKPEILKMTGEQIEKFNIDEVIKFIDDETCEQQYWRKIVNKFLDAA